MRHEVGENRPNVEEKCKIILETKIKFAKIVGSNPLDEHLLRSSALWLQVQKKAQ